MEKKEIKENECPICHNHCSPQQLGCKRGEDYFSGKGSSDGKHRPDMIHDISGMEPDDAVIALMRKCGHYLHHNVGHGSPDDTKALLAALSEEEKKELIKLLQKCTNNWNI